jgi:hypothetical protein
MFRSHIYRRLQCLTREKRAWQRSTFVPVAAFGSLVMVAEQWEDLDDKQKQEDSCSPLHALEQLIGPVQMYHHSTTRTLCDNMFTKLLRRKSAERISHLADKRKLDSAYDIDWDLPLGEGGFGLVYGAVDKKTKETVALKKISKDFTNDAGFQREMEAFLQIRANGGHPNICGLHDYFDEGGDYYLSLDLISGGEMFDHLINSGVSSMPMER